MGVFPKRSSLNEERLEVLRLYRRVHRVSVFYGVHDLPQLQAPESSGHRVRKNARELDRRWHGLYHGRCSDDRRHVVSSRLALSAKWREWSER